MGQQHEQERRSRPAVFLNGRIHCVDERHSIADAIAVRDGRLVAVGTREHVLAECPDSDVEDLDGATVIPGFVDAHHHVSLSALWSGQVTLRPPAVVDIESLQRTLRDHAAATPAGQWIVATHWDEGLLAERRPPTRAELDDAVPDNPLFAIHYTCHRAVANSRALELARIDASTANPAGGDIERARNGLPTGLLIERAMSRVEALSRADLITRDAEPFLDRMAKHYRDIVAAGITCVVDTAVPLDVLPLYREAVRRGDVLIPTIVCPTSSAGYLEEPWDVLEGPRTGESFGPVTIGPVKLVFDGAPGCAMCLSWWQMAGVTARTAMLSLRMGSADPLRAALSVAPRMGAQLRTGITLYQPEDARKVVGALTAGGFAVATHAIGNEAIEIAISAYESCASTLHAAAPARIEHAAFVGLEQVQRLSGLGISVSAQPAMLAMPSYAASPSIPGLPFFPLRRLLDAGVPVAGSSDFPVTTFDPLVGLRTAVRRVVRAGRVVDPEQTISLDEALAMFTREAARVTGVLHETGTLEVGKRADFLVLDGSFDDLGSLAVRRTFVEGRPVEPQNPA